MERYLALVLRSFSEGGCEADNGSATAVEQGEWNDGVMEVGDGD